MVSSLVGNCWFKYWIFLRHFPEIGGGKRKETAPMLKTPNSIEGGFLQ